MGKELKKPKILKSGEKKKRDPSTPRAVHFLDNKLAQVLLGSLRCVDNPTEKDRHIVKRLGFILALEACRNLPTEEKEIKTPLGPCLVPVLMRKVVLAPVLRAGDYLKVGAEELLPDAEVVPIWLSRDEVTLSSTLRWGKPVSDLKHAHVFVLDVMLATGGSASKAVETLKSWGADNITFVGVLSTQKGIERLQKDHPDIRVVLLHKDPTLQPNGYIYPGLGDAGDRLCGTVRREPKVPTKKAVVDGKPKETKKVPPMKPAVVVRSPVEVSAPNVAAAPIVDDSVITTSSSGVCETSVSAAVIANGVTGHPPVETPAPAPN